jgi:integrase
MRFENVDFEARTIFSPFGKTKVARRKVTTTAEVFELLKARAKAAEGILSFLLAEMRIPRLARSAKRTTRSKRSAPKITSGNMTYGTRSPPRTVAAGVDLAALSSILGHTKIAMTMRYVHPAEEAKRAAIGKLETFRLDGIVQAVQASHGVPTKAPTLN